MSKKTKKELLEDLADSTNQLEWLKHSHIPNLVEQLKLFKFTKQEIEEYELQDYGIIKVLNKS